MYVEVGPASLVIRGEKNGKAYAFLRREVESLVAGILRDIRECLPVLKQKALRIRNVSALPEVAKRMTAAAKMVDETTLTPMAAVAGAVADMVKEHFTARGLDLLMVNNGGDLSICNATGRTLTVGIGDIMTGKATPYVIRLADMREVGLATSGFGGRSLTLGIADTVTAIAGTGAVADAAATYICNCTTVETDGVIHRKARLIDPGTDIPDEDVTIEVGPLTNALVADALANGLKSARDLTDRSVIDYAVMALRGSIVTTDTGNDTNKNITLEVQDGNQEDRHHR
ncbi:MAG: hypothetical protein A4E60_02500 [Syntrophorhabdus sp. PtaB.Bin047]|nr:MAG: hypothetical protein A4E60_02500 [Syntrophorhabdus sp. PtaB.Bin047]